MFKLPLIALFKLETNSFNLDNLSKVWFTTVSKGSFPFCTDQKVTQVEFAIVQGVQTSIGR